MDTEAGPIRCDSSLSMIKIQPVNENNKQKHLFTSHKFTDPEIEELYQLHSANQKRTELFRCFLYAILFYCVAHIITYSAWICTHNNSTGSGHIDFATHHEVQNADYGDPVVMQRDSPSSIQQSWDPQLSSRIKKSVFNVNKRKKIMNFVVLNQPQSTVNSKAEQIESLKLEKSHHRISGKTDMKNFQSHQFSNIRKRQHVSNNVMVELLQDYYDDGLKESKPIVFKTRKVRNTKSATENNKKFQSLRQSSIGHFVEDSDDGVDLLSKNMLYLSIMMILLIMTGIIVILMLLPVPKIPRSAHIPVLLWSTMIIFSVSIDVESSVHPRLGLGWTILETFLIWVTLPMRIRAAFFYTVTLATLYLLVTSCRVNNHFHLGRQLGANITMLIMTNLMGLVSFYLSDKKQRIILINTRQSLEMKLVIEEQAKEQERLLLSVLPEHLALKMRQDLGAATDGQFKKIYMSRHENVSILYADIVGFTAISSTYSASELVKILNELFARFDRLAEKYNQLRIKILGDCYYCICGAPEERPDHAILCVHMGLSMVKAIIYVREKTKSSVDMRVGIHTGAILAGVLGQRQWQFDIYSRDVELANKMESSGQAGRVHVSETTLGFLNNEFEVEPAHGEKREENLRIAGIKTYFIVRPLVPFKETKSNSIAENGDLPAEDVITKDLPSDLMSTVAEDSNSAAEEMQATRKKSDLEAYRLRLKEELLSRDGFKDLSRQSQWLTLKFQDAEKESEFTKHKDPYAGIYSAVCPCALVAVGLANFFAISFTILGLVVLIVGVVILSLLSSFSACEDSPLKSRLMKLSGILYSICSLESELWVRRLVSVLTALILATANLAFMVPCLTSSGCFNITVAQMEEYDMEVKPPLVLPNTDGQTIVQANGCLFPSYLIAFATVFLLSVTLLPYLGSWMKSFIIVIVTLVHAVLIFIDPLKQVLNCSERLLKNDEDRLLPVACYLALFGGVVLADLFALTRRLEKSSRVLFLWKTEVEHQREKATQLRQKNEALVYNILPQHVATHFLGSRRRKHEELYSQSYSEVGILFASMPNFSDFYSEETVNNQGLECLRFLNEVISDFDALLELPKFADHIIKIKTIGSTYMAASGLSPSKQARSEDPLKVRWQHLALLVAFAFELKRALNGINEQSFNHFVLKMGINHGPITAGVIGARKPHYDIWGNSVNVASRMESTGRSGCIQVTEETYRILCLYGFCFEQRGLVNVKGKGQLMTYYLISKGPEPSEEEQKILLAELEDTQAPHST